MPPRGSTRSTRAPDAGDRAAVALVRRYGDPVRGPGWNPRSPGDPRLNVPRTRALLDLRGAPDRDTACVVVAGTKGKGSTAAFLASALHAAGIRSGLYTSPHLQRWRERIRVDGVAASGRAFAHEIDAAIDLVPLLRRARPDLGEPSAFELITVAALAHFRRRRCRVAILEVGLGGRYDATNAVDAAVSVIATIDLDHREILGPTLARIAREKAGVLRPGRPALLARQRRASGRALARACREVGARCRTVAPLPAAARLGLRGAHQRQNAALARAAAVELRALGLAIPERAIRRGLRDACWPGRLERIAASPAVVLDGAHTPASAAAIAAELAAARGTLRLVLGCTSDRDPRALARPFLARETVVYATAASTPRARPADEVARALRRSVGGVVPRVAGAYASVADAIASARADARGVETVLVTGSIALVGEAREALGLPVVERLFG